MDTFAQTILVGAAAGIIGGCIIGLLTAFGVSQMVATILGVGLVGAAVNWFQRTRDGPKS